MSASNRKHCRLQLSVLWSKPVPGLRRGSGSGERRSLAAEEGSHVGPEGGCIGKPILECSTTRRKSGMGLRSAASRLAPPTEACRASCRTKDKERGSLHFDCNNGIIAPLLQLRLRFTVGSVCCPNLSAANRPVGLGQFLKSEHNGQFSMVHHIWIRSGDSSRLWTRCDHDS